MPHRLKPLRRTSLTAQVVKHLRDYIYGAGLKPGDRLPTEVELAARLGVSRPTVRQGLKALEVAGLLSSQPRDGIRVRAFAFSQAAELLADHFHLNKASIYDLLEARCTVEYAAVPLVVRRISTEKLAELRRIETDFEEALDAGNYARATALDELLHVRFLEATGNQVLTTFVTLLQSFFHHPKHTEWLEERNFGPDVRRATIDEHRAFLDAMEARNVATTQAILAQHLGRTLGALAREEGRPQEESRIA
jgi:GntR family transcriptional repressor for pyruvate dehydrogenase complex